MSNSVLFEKIGRLPAPDDNAAIAIRRLEAGTTIRDRNRQFSLNSTVLEGHRFAVQPIAAGQPLLSWGLPFGIATRMILPGEYVCNSSTLAALRQRTLQAQLPAEPNFVDHIQPYRLNDAGFQPAEQLPLYPEPRTFWGYRRPGERGVGTRNFIVLLGVTSRAGGFVRQLEQHFAGETRPNLDGVVAAAHTEGSTPNPNNLDYLLRTLAGFIVHPNVGAVLIAGYNWEPVTPAMLHQFLIDHHYPLANVPHRFLSLSGSHADDMQQAKAIVRDWLAPVSDTPRTEESAAALKIALQCGGSDAFSGISGNPLAAWVAKEIIRCGGSANLAETPELIGAEPYVLAKVRNLDTARRFLERVERFQTLAAWHGASAEGNPSGGNKFRGLYNIVLKSIGAAMKRDPEVRLDYVIDYSELMPEPGYYLMDSPGLDLESVAGQVAAGCNLVFFITGNGSITNFPFVPTIKFVTTTARFELLRADMDVNAGAYLDGRPMAELAQETFELTLQVAAGQRTAGEKAGHAQVQIWRNWQQTEAGHAETLLNRPAPSGRPLVIKPAAPPVVQIDGYRTGRGIAFERLGLVLPTSLCSAQVAQLVADRLNRGPLAGQLARFVALPHTEGCTDANGPARELSVPTLLGYATHPAVQHCLLLEHGCEVTHNDFMAERLRQLGFAPDDFGWASIQLDGGIGATARKIEQWFAERLAAAPPPAVETVGLESLRLGLLASAPLPDSAAESLSLLARQVVQAGGAVVIPHNAALLESAAFLDATFDRRAVSPSLAYGQKIPATGLHVMDTPTAHWVETLTGLGATGVDVLLAFVGGQPLPGHPLLPLLQLAAAPTRTPVDFVFGNDVPADAAALLHLLAETASRRVTPRLQDVVDFQLTRGLLGISL
ncbi:MAG: Galactarate dehydratase (L-threo-forming) [Anaerolineae bacterium]|nr:Galactarate dehydratase (L-threo-forming) [Anaerolineae bacterium]